MKVLESQVMTIYPTGYIATIAYDFDLNYEFDYEVDERTFNENTNIPYHPPGSGYLSAPICSSF